jgi:HEPN domain-containing protein
MAAGRTAEAKRWFQQAVADLEAARWNIEGGFYSTAAFLAQQGAEKALKSLLYQLGARRSALLTHSLVEMVQEARGRVEALGGLVEEARELDLHYIPSRYPNGLPSGYPHQFYGRETAERAVRDAAAILDAVTRYYRSQGASEIVDP